MQLRKMKEQAKDAEQAKGEAGKGAASSSTATGARPLIIVPDSYMEDQGPPYRRVVGGSTVKVCGLNGKPVQPGRCPRGRAGKDIYC